MDTQSPKPPEQPQPNPKRPKLTTAAPTDITTTTTPTPTDTTPSPTTTPTATTATTTPTPTPTGTTNTATLKRHKIALIFAYCGVGYQGMQKNPGAKTIEEDLHQALFQSAALLRHELPNPRSFDWARSARTDKGVSAVGQVCSGRFYIDPDHFIQRLNSNLPDQIRVFGFKRVKGAFNAQKFCDRRRYVYLVPVFALDGRAHESGDGVCSECLDSGRNVRRVLGKWGSDSAIGDVDGNSRSGTASKSECGEQNSDSVNLLNSKCEDGNSQSSTVSNISCEDGKSLSSNVSNIRCEDGKSQSGNLLNSGCDDRNSKLGNLSNNGCSLNQLQNEGGSLGSLGTVVGDRLDELKGGEEQHDDGKVCGLDENVGVVEVKKSEFSYGEKERERFNRVLRYYEGTHNFHNFTARITAQDPSAKRYIVSFNADTTVNVDGIEFVKCEVVGQSFLLHQIRKMIGLAVVIMRGIAPETLIETAFRRDVKINVPVAPEVGLYLDECFFSPYNKKKKDGHDEVSMKAYTQEAEDFKLQYIYPHIASMEQKEGTVALWLHYLNHHNYPDLFLGSCTKEENVELQDLRTKNGSSSSVNIEAKNACISVNGSLGGNSSTEKIALKDVDVEGDGDGNNDFQNVEVKDMDQ